MISNDDDDVMMIMTVKLFYFIFLLQHLIMLLVQTLTTAIVISRPLLHGHGLRELTARNQGPPRLQSSRDLQQRPLP